MVGEDGGDLADEAVLQRVGDDVVVRQEPAPHAFEQEKVLRPGEFDQVAGLGGVAGEGLLDQDRLAGFEDEPGLVVVLGVRGGDVDDVDPGSSTSSW